MLPHDPKKAFLRFLPLEDRLVPAGLDVRSYDGSGNNLLHSDWGQTGTDFIRIAPAAYADGVSTPAGADRPSPRLISNALADQGDSDIISDRNLSAMMYAWGQFIDHDLDLTKSGSELFNIAIPTGDATFDPTGTGTATMPVTFRSADDLTVSCTFTSDLAGNAVVLASGRNFFNTGGAGAFNLTGGGRFLIYSIRPDQDTIGGLTGNRLYNYTYAGNPPASILATGNQFLYSYVPTLQVTANNQSAVFGAGVPTLTYVISGVLPGDSYSGAPLLTTTGVNVGTYALPIQAPGVAIQYEASAVAWNRSTNTLFVVGDGGRYIQQVSLKGVVIDSMALPTASGTRAGVEFDDPEGLTWIGGSTFVMTEERSRNVVRFDYAAGATLARSNTSTVKLGTTVGNTGLEGVTYDAPTSSFILVNQAAGNGGSKQNIFQASVTFAGTGGSATAYGTATPINSATVNAPSLFPSANIGFADLNDVYALSNVAGFAGAGSNNLLVLTNAGGLKEVTRAGTVVSQLTLPSGTAQIEGITMDDRGYIYVVSDNGDFGNSQFASSLFVYAPVPEPGTYPLLLAGLGAVAVVARRRAARA
jgi:uncharacterized protein YjiK